MTWANFYSQLSILFSELKTAFITPVVEDFGQFFVILFSGIAVSAIFAVLRQFARIKGD